MVGRQRQERGRNRVGPGKDRDDRSALAQGLVVGVGNQRKVADDHEFVTPPT